MEESKKQVYDFWESASCGESLYLDNTLKEGYQKHTEKRLRLEPYIVDFADFNGYKGKKVLEIGVGLGSDHCKFAEAGAIMHGVDLTPKAIQHTKKRLRIFKLKSELSVQDAESLPFEDGFFDLVYSWGVLHHTPETGKAVDEVHRVLKPSGEAKIMIYHKFSFVGYMLWVRYALFALKPFTSLSEIYAKYLESPGTKAYTVGEAKGLFRKFRNTEIETVLTHGDLLSSQAGQRHQGSLLTFARRIWPRRIIKKFFPGHGLFMLIKAVK